MKRGAGWSSLRELVAKLVDTDDFLMAGTTLARRPELLAEDADAVLMQLMAEALREADDDRAALLG